MNDKTDGCILFVKAGEKVTPAFIEKAIQTYPDFWGMAYIDKGELKIFKGPERRNEVANICESIDLATQYSDTLVHLGKAQAGKFDRMNMQPFTVLSDKHGNILVSCLEGDFEAWARKNGAAGLGEPFWVNAAFPGQWFGPVFRQQDENIDTFMKHIDIYDNRILMNRLYGGRGMIVFMAKNGVVLKYFKGNDDTEYRDYPWGWASRHCGHTEENVVSLPESVTKKAKQVISNALGGTASIKTNEDGTKEISSTPVVKNEQMEQAHVNKPVGYIVKQRGTNSDGTVTEYIVPPSDVESNAELRAWYMKYGVDPETGSIPNKHNRKKRVPVKIIKPAVPNEEVSVVKNKDHTTADDYNKEHATEILKFHDRSMKKTKSIKELKTMVENRTPFYATLNLNSIDDLFGWPSELRAEFCKNFPEEATRLIEDLCVEVVDARTEADEREAAAQEQNQIHGKAPKAPKQPPKQEPLKVHEDVSSASAPVVDVEDYKLAI